MSHKYFELTITPRLFSLWTIPVVTSTCKYVIRIATSFPASVKKVFNILFYNVLTCVQTFMIISCLV